jgi:hypothetical protein
MAKTLYDYSTPVVANVPVGPAINTGAGNFELRTSLIVMVQASQFYGLPSEDASAHLQHFLELCNTIIIKDVAPASIRLCLFPFSLVGKVKQWFYKEKEAVSTWDKYSMAFLVKFFPIGKTNALRGKISSFQQTSLESIPEARDARLHPSLLAPRDGKLAHAPELLQGSYAYIKGARGCRYWRSVPFPDHRWCYDSHRE